MSGYTFLDRTHTQNTLSTASNTENEQSSHSQSNYQTTEVTQTKIDINRSTETTTSESLELNNSGWTQSHIENINTGSGAHQFENTYINQRVQNQHIESSAFNTKNVHLEYDIPDKVLSTTIYPYENVNNQEQSTTETLHETLITYGKTNLNDSYDESTQQKQKIYHNTGVLDSNKSVIQNKKDLISGKSSTLKHNVTSSSYIKDLNERENKQYANNFSVVDNQNQNSNFNQTRYVFNNKFNQSRVSNKTTIITHMNSNEEKRSHELQSGSSEFTSNEEHRNIRNQQQHRIYSFSDTDRSEIYQKNLHYHKQSSSEETHLTNGDHKQENVIEYTSSNKTHTQDQSNVTNKIFTTGSSVLSSNEEKRKQDLQTISTDYMSNVHSINEHQSNRHQHHHSTHSSSNTDSSDIHQQSLNMNNSFPKNSHPADNNFIIIFVLGGIKAHEVNLLQKIFNSTVNKNLLIGSTKLITPIDIINTVLELRNKKL